MISDVLLEAALRSLALGVVVGLGLWMARSRGARLQTMAWMLVLAGAVAMPWLMRQRTIAIHPPRQVAASAPLLIRRVRASFAPAATAVASPSAPLPAAHGVNWRGLALGVYAGIAALVLLRVIVGLLFTLRLWRNASRVREPWAASLHIRETAAIGAPATFGSGILLPADWRTWDDLRLRAVVAHERAHVEWGDFYVQLLNRFHLAVFWFSPLAWWLRNRLTVLAEVACDDAALQAVANGPRYAEILLGFARQPQQASALVAMARPGALSHRVERILKSAAAPASTGWKRYALMASGVLGVALLVSGCTIHAQSAPAASAAAQAQDTSPGRSSSPSRSSETTEWRLSSDEHGNSYALVRGDSMTMSGSSEDIKRARSFRGKFTGDYIWFEHAGNEYLITDDATVRRALDLWQPIDELGRRQGELGDAQGKLGDEQGKLGEQQEAASVALPPDVEAHVQMLRKAIQDLRARLSAEMAARLEASDAILAKEEEELKAAAGKQLTQEQIGELQERAGEAQEKLSEDFNGHIGELQRQIGELQAGFAELQSHVGEAQAKLGEEQARLGEQQAKLGEEQAKLGEEQERLAKEAERQMRSLFDECLKNGLARPAH